MEKSKKSSNKTAKKSASNKGVDLIQRFKKSSELANQAITDLKTARIVPEDRLRQRITC